MSAYWDQRAAEDMARTMRDTQAVLADIRALNEQAAVRVRMMATRIRQRLMRSYALTKDKALELLAAPCGREEYLHLLEEISKLGRKNPMRDELMARAAAPAYAHRISVQEALISEIDAVTAHLAEQEAELVQRHLMEQVRESSLHTGYRIARESGVCIAFGGVREDLAAQLIAHPWSGASFSARIWQNQEKLTELLNTVLREGIVTGRSGDKMASDIADAMNVSIHRAQTLVRTETAYATGVADLEAFREAGVERYRFVAVLDMRTSKVCQELDGQTFAVSEARVGVNYRPMHPNCRSTATAALDAEALARMRRVARDPITGKTVKVSAATTYKQWLNTQQETYGEQIS